MEDHKNSQSISYLQSYDDTCNLHGSTSLNTVTIFLIGSTNECYMENTTIKVFNRTDNQYSSKEMNQLSDQISDPYPSRSVPVSGTSDHEDLLPSAEQAMLGEFTNNDPKSPESFTNVFDFRIPYHTNHIKTTNISFDAYFNDISTIAQRTKSKLHFDFVVPKQNGNYSQILFGIITPHFNENKMNIFRSLIFHSFSYILNNSNHKKSDIQILESYLKLLEYVIDYTSRLFSDISHDDIPEFISTYLEILTNLTIQKNKLREIEAIVYLSSIQVIFDYYIKQFYLFDVESFERVIENPVIPIFRQKRNLHIWNMVTLIATRSLIILDPNSKSNLKAVSDDLQDKNQNPSTTTTTTTTTSKPLTPFSTLQTSTNWELNKNSVFGKLLDLKISHPLAETVILNVQSICSVMLRADSSQNFPLYKSFSSGLILLLAQLKILRDDYFNFPSYLDWGLQEEVEGLTNGFQLIQQHMGKYNNNNNNNSDEILLTVDRKASRTKERLDQLEAVSSFCLDKLRSSSESTRIFSISNLNTFLHHLQQVQNELVEAISIISIDSNQESNTSSPIMSSISIKYNECLERYGVTVDTFTRLLEIQQLFSNQFHDTQAMSLDRLVIGSQASDQQQKSLHLFQLFWNMQEVQSYYTIRELSSLGEESGIVVTEGGKSDGNGNTQTDVLTGDISSMGYVSVFVGYGSKSAVAKVDGQEGRTDSTISTTKQVVLRQPLGLAHYNSDIEGEFLSEYTEESHFKGIFISDSGNNCVRLLHGKNTKVEKFPMDPSIQISFASPRGLCLHFDFSTTRRPKGWLVVADSTNHSIICLNLYPSPSTQEDNLLRFGTNQSGYRDGAVPQFNGPNGVTSWRNQIIICDRNNHVLRAIQKGSSATKKVASGWGVFTLVGKAGQPGTIDGGPLTDSRLQFPTGITSSSTHIYFTEQGAKPGIRSFDGHVVTTIFRGLPLKNPNGVCLGRNSQLLVCDSTASVIWSVSLDGEINPLVTLQDMPPSPRHILSTSSRDSFTPCAIVKVAEGSYLFSETSRSQIFRYMDAECALKAADLASQTFHSVHTIADKFEDSIQSFLGNYEKTFNLCKEISVDLFRCKQKYITHHFQSEVTEYFKRFSVTGLHNEMIAIWFRNASNLQCVATLLSKLQLGRNKSSLQEICQTNLNKTIVSLFTRNHFNSPYVIMTEELQGLRVIMNEAKSVMSLQDLICMFLKDDQFTPEITPEMLSVMAIVFSEVNWSMDRSVVADLRREVVRWLTRLIERFETLQPMRSSSFSVQNAGAQETLLTETMVSVSFWNDIYSKCVALDSQQAQALRWISRIQLESLVMGSLDATSIDRPPSSSAGATEIEIGGKTSTGGRLKSSRVKLDRGVVTLQLLRYISILPIHSNLLVILSDALCEGARAIPSATETVAAIMSSPTYEHPTLTNVLAPTNIVESKLESMSSASISRYSYLFQNIWISILKRHVKILTRRILQKGDYESEDDILTYDKIYEYLFYETYMWCQAVYWLHSADYEFTRYNGCEGKISVDPELKEYIDNISIAFTTFSNLVISGQVPIEVLKRLATNLDIFVGMWRAIGSPLADSEYVTRLWNEFEDLYQDSKTIVKVLTVLLPNLELLETMQAAVNNWSSLMMNYIRLLFAKELPDNYLVMSKIFSDRYSNYPERILSFKPLPEILLQSFYWLHYCIDNSLLFRHLWRFDEDSMNNIILMSEIWSQLLDQITKREILSGDIETNSRYLLEISEISVLVGTVSGIQSFSLSSGDGDDVKQCWEVTEASQEQVNTICEDMKKWEHIYNIYSKRDQIRTLMDVSKLYVNPDRVHEIASLQETLHKLVGLLDEQGPMIGQKLSEILSVSEYAQLIDKRFFVVNENLVKSIKANEPLITWLRTIRDDSTFKSNAEISLGLQEMECPIELWDVQKKRVNEEYISKLQNIRGYLHHFLYNQEVVLESVNEFLNEFGSLNAMVDADVISENIQTCFSVRTALMMVIGNNSEGAASNRLALLYQPKCASVWVCERGSHTRPSDSLDTEHGHGLRSSETDLDTVYLKYRAVDMDSDGSGASTVWRRHQMAELQDFQGNIVLARSNVTTPELERVIDLFLQQFSWIKKLSEVMTSLYLSGHLDYYPSYLFEISVTQTIDEIKLKVHQLEDEYQEWSRSLDSARTENYFFNFMELKHLTTLVEILKELQANKVFLNDRDDEEMRYKVLHEPVQKLISYVNIDLAYDVDFTEGVCASFFNEWERNYQESMKFGSIDGDGDLNGVFETKGSEENNNYITNPHLFLRILARSVHFSLIPIRKRVRSFNIYEDFDGELTSELFGQPKVPKGGVFVMTAPSDKMEFDLVLTLYAMNRRFPEAECCLLCSAETTVEQLTNFFRRWEYAPKYDRLDLVYCIFQSHTIPYDVQFKALEVLKSITYNHSKELQKMCTLVISSVSGQTCLLASHFLQNKAELLPLTSEGLACLGSRLSAYGYGTHSHYSHTAGAGKSFDIRLKAWRNNMKYLHAPINSNHMSTTAVINTLKSAVHSKATTEKKYETETRGESNSVGCNPDVSLVRSSGLNRKQDSVLLHLDIAYAVKTPFMNHLFKLCVLNSLQDDFEVFVLNPARTLICLELSYNQLFVELSHCLMYPMYTAHASPSSFCMDEESLRAGMGFDFESPLHQGISTSTQSSDVKQLHSDKSLDDSISTTDSKEELFSSYRRLRYVAIALQTLHDNNGAFPHDFTVQTKAALYGGKHNADFQNVKSEKVFEYLLEASDLKVNTSLWCLWSFINVVFWQLREMHHAESPLNSACMPDPSTTLVSSQQDRATKMRIKGEVVNFILRTAREFATRQISKKVDPNRVVSVSSVGFSRKIFNQTWIRERFDNDGQPCFRSGCSGYFLYYRSLSEIWVIDDTIEPSGSAYSCSTTPDINSKWITSNSWANTDYITAEKIRVEDKEAYNNEAIVINGCQRLSKESSASIIENGVYKRLPPYDDINDRPHYLKNSANGRRHLFYSSSHYWQISPVCNEEQGMFACTMNNMLNNHWRILPPDTHESGVKFKFRRAGDGLQAKGETTSESVVTVTETDQSIYETNPTATGLEVELMRWEDSNHECILFSNENHMVNFLSLDPKRLRKNMHPSLLKHLEQNQIVVGEELASINKRHWQLLSDLTGVMRSSQDASKLLGGSFCLTGDALLKILAIIYRMRCGVPVVLLGECGCGKTMLLKYLCAWMNLKLLILDVHGGTSEQDILSFLANAEKELVQSDSNSIFVFLDEVNTCHHMGLINEAICHRSVNGKRLHDGIRILAALNPYRLRKTNSIVIGLSYHASNETSKLAFDPMSRLVYRVHPIPPTLQDYIFDFGALDQSTELQYIQRMAEAVVKGIDENEVGIIAALIDKSQRFLREQEGDPSVVSLRDVNRCLQLLLWFFDKLGGEKSMEIKDRGLQEKKTISPRCRATVLALAHVYCYRLPTTTARTSYWVAVSAITKTFGKVSSKYGFSQIESAGFAQSVVEKMQKRFIKNLEIEEGIALNEALTENLFVTIICILNRIPIFIVGKPGTSKTLAIQIIASNLQGKQSPKGLWRRFPSVYIFQYQCSPLSTADSILFQYHAACSYQRNAQDTITVLLLDEIGLAEMSPDMPLKVLHYMLVDSPIAIVGISNWTLDSSKMNRAVCLQRPEPSAGDLVLTGKNILTLHGSAISSPNKESMMVSSSSSSTTTAVAGLLKPVLKRSTSSASRSQPWLYSLAKAFHHVYTHQKDESSGSRDFIGLRDYYALLKLLKQELADIGTNMLNLDVLIRSVARNFGGKPFMLPNIVDTFVCACSSDIVDFDSWQGNILDGTPAEGSSLRLDCIKEKLETEITAVSLIRENLSANNARHLMLLTTNDTALHLLFSCQILNEKDVDVLVGSQFKEDLQELHLINQINQVKNAMALGKTVILLNHDRIYESLYDVLNMRFVTKTDIETGKIRRMLRLALGPRSQLCPVEDTFKLIVIVNKQHAYHNLDLPLLNRFEKQVFESSNMMTKPLQNILHKLENWCEAILSETQFSSLNEVFCGYYTGTCPSLIIYIHQLLIGSKHSDSWNIDGARERQILMTAKKVLLEVALPAPILHSKTLNGWDSSDDAVVDRSKYWDEHNSLFSYLNHAFEDSEINQIDASRCRLMVIMTKSSLTHFDKACHSYEAHSYNNDDNENSKDQLNREKRHIKVSNVNSLQLALVGSESHFQKSIAQFYSRDNNAHTTNICAHYFLFILCDPVECDLSLIAHAKYICQKQRSIYQETRSQNTILNRDYDIDSSCKHIVFLLHLPPSFHIRERLYMLEFHQPWEYTFIDDLRDPRDVSGTPIRQLLESSLYQLCIQEDINFNDYLMNSVNNALSLSPVPATNITIKYRIQMIRDLLRQTQFFSYIKTLIIECFKKLNQMSHSVVPFHVLIACSDASCIGGNLTECLQMAIQSLFSQAFAHILRHLDRDFNLLWVYQSLSGSENVNTHTNLWFQLCNSLCSIETLADSCPFVMPSKLHTVDIMVPNHGKFYTLLCRFPFSYRLIQMLGNDRIRLELEKKNATVSQMKRSLRSIMRSFLTEEIMTLQETLLSHNNSNKDSYLHDFVSITINPFQNLKFEIHLDIVKLFIDSCHMDDQVDEDIASNIYNPVNIHVCYWKKQFVIFQILSIFSSIETSSLEKNYNIPLTNMVMESLKRSCEDRTQKSTVDNVQIRFLSKILSEFLKGFQNLVIQINDNLDELKIVAVDSLKKQQEMLSNPNYIRMVSRLYEYLEIFEAIEAPLESLIRTLLHDFDDSSRSQPFFQEVNLTILNPWWGLRLVNLLIHEYRYSLASKWPITKIFDVLKVSWDSSPNSFSSLIGFWEAVSLCNKSNLTKFIYVYFMKFMKRERGLLRNTIFFEPLNESFLALLGVLLAAEQNVYFNDLKKMDVQFIQKTILEFIMTSSGESQFPEILRVIEKSVRINIDIAQMYLQRYYDLNIQEEDLDTSNVKMTEEAVQELLNLQMFSDSSMITLSVLESVATITYHIQRFAQQVYEFLINLEENHELTFPSCDSFLLRLMSDSPDIHLYLMKSIRNIGQDDVLLLYLNYGQLPFPLPPPIKKGSRKIDSSLPFDPFSMLFNLPIYDKFLTIFHSLLRSKANVDEDIGTLRRFTSSEPISSLNSTTRCCYIVCALYRQLLEFSVLPDIEEERPVIDLERLQILIKLMCSINFYSPSGQLVLTMIKWLTDNNRDLYVRDRSKTRVYDEQIFLHLMILSIQEPDSWLAQLFLRPGALSNSYIPSMPGSEWAHLMGLNVGELAYVGWYVCPNGHPYAVGNCTFPMEIARCPADGCSARIGGESHEPVKGVTRLGNTSDLQSSTQIKGYSIETVKDPNSYERCRVGVITTQVLRFIIHHQLLFSQHCLEEDSDGFRQLLFPKSRTISRLRIAEELLELKRRDWGSLAQFFSMNYESLALVIHLILKEWESQSKSFNISLPPPNMTVATRSEFERSFQSCVESIAQACKTQDLTRKVLRELSDSKSSLLVSEILDVHRNIVFEYTLPSQTITAYRAQLWRLRQPVSFGVFKKWFYMKEFNSKRYKLLATVLNLEHQLPFIRYIADIFAWHKILFNLFVPGSLTREEANIITNEDVLSRLTESEHDEAKRILSRYCEAFNKTLPLVHNLYECNPNPFLTEDGKAVDLSGAHGKGSRGNVAMAPDTAISFSLPSMSAGDTDASGLCTIRLLNTLEDLNNRVVEELIKHQNDDNGDGDLSDESAMKGDRRVTREQTDVHIRQTAVTPALQEQRQREQEQQEQEQQRRRTAGSVSGKNQAQAEEMVNMMIPPTNYLTPSSVLDQRLIFYDRNTHLLPSILLFSNQSLYYGQGNLNGFDFKRINYELRESLLLRASPLALQVRQYQYAGELRRSDGIALLRQRVKLEPLPSAILEQIFNEIDTQNRLARILLQLEECISFLTAAAAGGGSAGATIDENMSLEMYILDTLMVPLELWKEISCASLAHVNLKHLQCLYSALEEKQKGDILSNVSLKYREPLSPEIEALLTPLAKTIDFTPLINDIRMLATEQLVTGNWPADAPMKEYLCYCDPELEGYDWFSSFPELPLNNSYALYYFLRKLA